MSDKSEDCGTEPHENEEYMAKWAERVGAGHFPLHVYGLSNPNQLPEVRKGLRDELGLYLTHPGNDSDEKSPDSSTYNKKGTLITTIWAKYTPLHKKKGIMVSVDKGSKWLDLGVQWDKLAGLGQVEIGPLGGDIYKGESGMENAQMADLLEAWAYSHFPGAPLIDRFQVKQFPSKTLDPEGRSVEVFPFKLLASNKRLAQEFHKLFRERKLKPLEGKGDISLVSSGAIATQVAEEKHKTGQVSREQNGREMQEGRRMVVFGIEESDSNKLLEALKSICTKITEDNPEITGSIERVTTRYTRDGRLMAWVTADNSSIVWELVDNKYDHDLSALDRVGEYVTIKRAQPMNTQGKGKGKTSGSGGAGVYKGLPSYTYGMGSGQSQEQWPPSSTQTTYQSSQGGGKQSQKKATKGQKETWTKEKGGPAYGGSWSQRTEQPTWTHSTQQQPMAMAHTGWVPSEHEPSDNGEETPGSIISGGALSQTEVLALIRSECAVTNGTMKAELNLQLKYRDREILEMKQELASHKDVVEGVIAKMETLIGKMRNDWVDMKNKINQNMETILGKLSRIDTDSDEEPEDLDPVQEITQQMMEEMSPAQLMETCQIMNNKALQSQGKDKEFRRSVKLQIHEQYSATVNVIMEENKRAMESMSQAFEAGIRTSTDACQEVQKMVTGGDRALTRSAVKAGNALLTPQPADSDTSERDATPSQPQRVGPQPNGEEVETPQGEARTEQEGDQTEDDDKDPEWKARKRSSPVKAVKSKKGRKAQC